MADRWAVATGNWSSTSTWNGGTLPTAADDVYADGFTVTINQNVTVLSVRTTQRSGGTAGGGFTLGAGWTLTANAIAGTTACVTFNSSSPDTATIAGNCTGGSSVNAHGANNNSTGTLIITGNCTGGSTTSANGSHNTSSGTLNITGNCIGGTGGSSIGANNNSNGTMTITGNCTGGSGGTAIGANNVSNGTMGITGNCTGGSNTNAIGANNGSSGIVSITGSCTGGSGNSADGARNSSSGTLSIIGNCTGGSSTGASGARNSFTGTVTITGNCTGGSATETTGVGNFSSGTLTITGNCIGGSGATAFGVWNNSNGTLTITGNCTGGSSATSPGAANSSSGTLTINGSAIASNVAHGASNQSTGLMTVKRAIGNGWGIGNVGSNSITGVLSQQSGSQTRVEELEFGSLGQAPVGGAVSVPDLATNVCLVHRLSAGKKTLIDPSASTGQANEADVRFGTSYALGNKTGTLRVPAAGSVALNVPVDNTVGTAVLTVAALQAALPQNAPVPVVRSVNDTRAVTFSWPVSGATITGQKSINNAAYSAVSGAISFLRTDEGKHYYTLAYNVNDRSTTEGVVRYKFTDGTYTRFVTLQLTDTADQVWDEPYTQHTSAGSFGGLVNSLDERLPAALVSGRMNSFVDVVSSGAVQDIFETYPLVETYAPSGTLATPAQMLYFMQQTFSQFSISGVYISVKKLDGTTEAARFILDDQQTPTSRTRIS